jgi:hypothetical protein
MSTEEEAASPSGRMLTKLQKKRIGPRLQRLIRGKDLTGPQSIEPVGKRGGASVYEVLIYGDNPDALREAGIPLGTVQGGLMTARLTIDQILKAAMVDAVQNIQAATKQQMHRQTTKGGGRP